MYLKAATSVNGGTLGLAIFDRCAEHPWVKVTASGVSISVSIAFSDPGLPADHPGRRRRRQGGGRRRQRRRRRRRAGRRRRRRKLANWGTIWAWVVSWVVRTVVHHAVTHVANATDCGKSIPTTRCDRRVPQSLRCCAAFAKTRDKTRARGATWVATVSDNVRVRSGARERAPGAGRGQERRPRGLLLAADAAAAAAAAAQAGGGHDRGGGVHSGRVGALRAGVGIGGELGQGRKDDLPPSRVGVDGRVDGLRRCRRQGVGDAGIRGADVGWW